MSKEPKSAFMRRCKKTGMPRCSACGNLGWWGEEHDCPGPSKTGTWIQDHGEDHADFGVPSRYEVRFAFEGETSFDDLADAQEAAREYERIVARIVEEEESEAAVGEGGER